MFSNHLPYLYILVFDVMLEYMDIGFAFFASQIEPILLTKFSFDFSSVISIAFCIKPGKCICVLGVLILPLSTIHI
jgi:hypothetical protein